MRHYKRRSPRGSVRRSHKKPTSSKKRSSLHKRSSSRKNTSPKRRSSSHKRSSHKKRSRVKSHYRMRGMGTLLSMYGQAGGSLEQDVEAKRKELKDLQTQLSAEKSAERREKIKKAMDAVQGQINQLSEKMKQLLRGAAETASKAANFLSEGAKGLGSKLSEGLASFGSKLSSGLKSATSDISNRYQDYKDRQALSTALKAEQDAKRAQAKADAQFSKVERRLSEASSRYSSPSSSRTSLNSEF